MSQLKQNVHGGLIQIGLKDIYWNYAATFLKIASSALLLPLILRMMTSQTVGIWTVFMTVTSFIGILDFGFSPSFTRNVTYVFSGVRFLTVEGFSTLNREEFSIDYGLLNGVISAMKWFYLRAAIFLILLLGTIGTYYIYWVLKTYNGDHVEIYFAWVLLCIVSTYNLFTLYYESLLQGKGLVKRSKQIVIIGQLVYLAIASIAILSGKGLIAIVSAQIASVIIIRWLSYRSFFTAEIKDSIARAAPRSRDEILAAIYPNAFKIGLTSLGSFMVQRSAIVIGSLYLTLEEIASYGITMQLIAVIASLAGIYTATFQPRIISLRLKSDILEIKKLYLKGQVLIAGTFLTGGVGLLLLGSWVLDLTGSKTQLISPGLMLLALVLSFEQTNLSVAGGILLTKNEVPFFKAALISGAGIVIGLLIAFQVFKPGITIMLLIPLIVDVSYQTWKWPLEVKKELNIQAKDIILSIKNIRNS